MSTPAAIGVIGAGAIARMLHLPVLAAMPEVRIAWVADANDALAKTIADSFGVPHLPVRSVPGAVRDCTAALLAIPVGVRGPYFAALAEHQVGALVEKPFARDLAEHDRIAGMFPAHKLACGFMRRTYASTLQARQILAEGWLGRPLRIRVTEGGRTTRTGADRSYYDDPKATGAGILLELGCHSLDLVLHLTGAADHEIVRQQMVFDGHVDRRAEAEVRLYPAAGRGGAPVILEYTFSWLDRQANQVEIEFPDAILRFGTAPDAQLTILPRAAGKNGIHSRGIRLEPGTEGATTSNQAFCLEWRWLLEGLAAGLPSPVAADTCRPVTALIQDLYTAARGQR